ncbi:hypothetical protein POVCU2_0049130 [Plasmodium ovale curtisi]|uniref:Uncharacterized protein n=1 Tax=Plasmodium ovale curtisi TaxID=864141 RepID=A0A1A8WBH1_PLAOA|nr:hypothetical protein POVCU2_0049130 [Plasmodium ovale curtisi]
MIACNRNFSGELGERPMVYFHLIGLKRRKPRKNEKEKKKEKAWSLEENEYNRKQTNKSEHLFCSKC